MNDYTSTLINRTCLYCGKTFQRSLHQLLDAYTAEYCNRKCSGAARRAEKHTNWKGGHSDYRGANWNQQRDLAYKRYGDVCQVCQRKRKKHEKKFAVHHIKPFREFDGDYIAANDLSNLTLLCENCHPSVEAGKIAVQRPLL